MIDLRNNYAKRGLNEGKMVEQMAKRGQNEFLRFKNFEDLHQAIAKRPNLRVDTLVLSGHATGSCFVSDEDNNDTTPVKFSELTSRFPQVFSDTNAVYYMGCNTGIWNNSKGWLQPFRHQVIFTAANGIGPSNEDGSALLISRLEQERAALPPHPSDSDLLRARNNLLHDKAAFGAVIFGVADADTLTAAQRSAETQTNRKPRFTRIANNSKSIFRGDIYSPDNCEQPLSGLENFIRSPRKNGESSGSFENFFDYLDQFTHHSTHEMRDIPTSQFSELRRAYAFLQNLGGCSSFLTSSPRWQKIFRYNRNNPSGAICPIVDKDDGGLRDKVIALIHGDNLVHNYLICARPWIDAMIKRIEKCSKKTHQNFLLHLQKALTASSDSSARQMLYQAFKDSQFLDEKNSISDEAGNLVDSWEFVFDPSQKTFPSGWMTAISSANHRACASFRALNTQAKSIPKFSCNDQIDYEDFAPWDASMSTAPAQTPTESDLDAADRDAQH